jgi:hypothetical protein
MKIFKIVCIAILFLALVDNVSGQAKTYPFEVVKSGKGAKAIIFIAGFACSGAVWNETKAKYEKSFTCYTLTMAGFAGAKPQDNITFANWEIGIADFIRGALKQFEGLKQQLQEGL